MNDGARFVKKKIGNIDLLAKAFMHADQDA